jgi:diguanylate cyclase (GGDEF)-like protein
MRRLAPLTSDVTPRAAAAMHAAGVALALTWVVYLAYIEFLHRWEPGLGSFFKTWVFSGLVLGAAAICGARAVLSRTDRLAWGVLAAGMASWALGSIYWSVFLKGLAEPPYPSVADFLYLGFYPPAYFALMLLVRRRFRGIGVSVWLDGLIGILAIGALGNAFLLAPVLTGTGGSPAVVATNLAYPLADLLLIALVVVTFALAGWRPGRKWLLIGGGLVLFAIADSVYLYQAANSSFVEGTVLDAMWPAGMVLLAFAAWQAPPRSTVLVFEGWPVVVVPSLFTLGSLGVLIQGNFANTNPAALVLASATVVAALLRLGWSFREVRSLTESRRQATTDELTGLANRRFLYECLRRALAAGKREGSPVTLVIADLDGFKELNDTLGHHAGDLLLKQVGPRVRDCLRAGDTLARLGGDEFAVLMPRMDADAAIEVVERIRATLDRAFAVRGLTVHIEASIGLASFPEHADDPDSLVQRADVAMYQAKASRSGYDVYSPDRDLHSRDRLSLLGELRRAIEAGELLLHYQPKADLVTGQVTGVEALVRWQHPQRGLLPPGEFIPPAEQTALMRPLTLHVLESALRQNRLWLNQGIDLGVAINLSIPNLLDLRLPDDVQRLLDDSRLPPYRLQLEVTENIIMADPARVIAVLDRLRGIGVGLSLDDFGTGSSALSYLKRLPIDEVKIDRSFVIGMKHSKADGIIVRSTTELAQRLGLRVVAEGVEDAGTWQTLSAMGCEEAQGFHLQRALPADELTAWLADEASSSRVATPSFRPLAGAVRAAAA